MSYRLNRIHIIICILAATVLAAGFVWHLVIGIPSSLFTFAMWISGAIIVFYIIGTFVRAILIKKVFVPEEHDFSQDEEYQAFMENLNNEGEPPADVMQEEPLAEIEYDDSLSDPFMEPLEDVSK